MPYKNREEMLAAKRLYNKIHSVEIRENSRLWRINNKEKKKLSNRIYWRTYYRKNPEIAKKDKARRKLKYAIQTGKIKRQVCEAKKCRLLGEGHHDDYNKPLVVRWLCKTHHALHHHPL